MHTGEFKQEECKTGECIQENSSRKNAKRENAKRENAKRENAKRENAKRENAKRENAKLENAKRENAKRENANGENLSGENAMSIEKLSEVWPEWRVTGQIGEGSFGKVYKIVREEYGVTSYAALKVISIPQSDAEIKSLRVEGMDEQSTRSYFESIVKDFINEIKLMVSMKGTSNIVSVEDFKVIERTDIVGWDVLIRMELLTSFVDYLTDKTLSETEVIKLGQDVCSALELCSRRNIIHRDIKPENIFISDFGDYKIGDFGIARELEKTSGAMSSKGTYNYVAPEVITSKQYDSTVDIYSLGLVLYMLLNNNRLPFLDPNAQQILYQDRKNAIDRRISGVPLPAPVGASPQMSHAILQACSFNPGIRFKTANEFKNALEAVKTGVNLAPRSEEIDLYKTVVGRIAPGSDNAGIDSIPAERRTPEMSGAGIGVTAAERRAPGSGGVSFDSAT
ncbi:MAG: serine/threonine protein kinase, partial [Oscillospiraceae bacterium]|nr:serine/threonine protein kinase [Oscillospiraceae bacterium]